jgi:hypothetical protein
VVFGNERDATVSDLFGRFNPCLKSRASAQDLRDPGALNVSGIGRSDDRALNQARHVLLVAREPVVAGFAGWHDRKVGRIWWT